MAEATRLLDHCFGISNADTSMYGPISLPQLLKYFSPFGGFQIEFCLTKFQALNDFIHPKNGLLMSYA